MGARIRVAYATRCGSTAEIAQAIGKEQTITGHTADVTEIKTVATLSGYTTVVRGGPLYMGSLDGTVSKFIGNNHEPLQKLTVAAFAVGLAPKNPNPGAGEAAMAARKNPWGLSYPYHRSGLPENWIL